MKKLSSFLFIFLIGFIVAFLGNGYRHLWQDELDNAVKGQIVLDTGIPKVIDKNGRVALWLGGREIEEGELFRLTPWGQFYGTAVGLAVGPMLGLSKDQSARLPFAIAHALAMGGLHLGLTELAAVSPWPAIAIPLAFSIQSERLLHNRTARYHALLDLFAVLGILSIGGIRRRKKWALQILGSTIFILPQFHSVGGSFLSFIIGFQATLIICQSELSLNKKIKSIFLAVVLPGLISAIIILIQTRPWTQQSMFGVDPISLMGTYNTHKRLMYGYYFLLLSSVFTIILKERKLAVNIFASLVMMLTLAVFLEKIPLSQIRYYLSVPIICLNWPISFGWGSLKPSQIKILLALAFLFVLLPEFTTRRFSPFQGLKIVSSDTINQHKKTRQPFHEALNTIKEKGSPGDPVLIEWVPLYVNWYLPEYEVALMPDESGRTELNNANPIWDKPLKFPEWHIWFSIKGSGLYLNPQQSDFKVTNFTLANKTYSLTSGKLGLTKNMCIVNSYETSLANNAPFELIFKESLQPEGMITDRMILGRICD